MKVNGNLKFRELGAGELQNAILERLNGGALGGSFPTTGQPRGRLAYNLDTDTYWYFNGSVWTEFSASLNVANIIDSGGYMNGDGTFDPTAFNGFTNVTVDSSPVGDLVDVLSQLDAAIAGSNQLSELLDVDVPAVTGSPTPDVGALLQVGSDSPKRWIQTDVTGLADDYILQWDAATSTWGPSSGTGLLPAAGWDLNDGTTLRTVQLGEELSVDGTGIVGQEDASPAVTGTLRFYRLENLNSDAYIEVATSETDTVGNITIQAKDDLGSPGGIGGDLNLYAGDSGGAATEGGDINIFAGDNTVSNFGGPAP